MFRFWIASICISCPVTSSLSFLFLYIFMGAPPAPRSLFLPSSPGKKICRRTSTVPRKPESAPQVSSCLARSSVDLYQASCSSIHTLLLIPLPCKHVHLHAPNSSAMHAYIYIYGKFFLLLYTHTRAIHPCTMAETAGHGCSRPTASLPCKPALLCVPSLDFLLQHMQTLQIAPCMHVNNAS